VGPSKSQVARCDLQRTVELVEPSQATGTNVVECVCKGCKVQFRSERAFESSKKAVVGIWRATPKACQCLFDGAVN
jgi:hypothetical protein